MVLEVVYYREKILVTVLRITVVEILTIPVQLHGEDLFFILFDLFMSFYLVIYDLFSKTFIVTNLFCLCAAKWLCWRACNTMFLDMNLKCTVCFVGISFRMSKMSQRLVMLNYRKVFLKRNLL